MPLTPGTRLGPYVVESPLGAGGMGEVYRAHDSRLDRAVAIKVLPELLASDPDRIARFEREAKTLAALNHPNIAHVYGVEHAGAIHALVMELVDGEDLAQHLRRSALPVDQALAIARQLADALEAAHERGIIHRDLKPANIKVRDDGTVKVLDFGLAKAMDPATAGVGVGGPFESPTLTSPMMTEAGLVLGTAAYMAPEQAKGKTVDKRADIWAFGVVLYEMLTGGALFARDSVAETIGAVVTIDPDWTRLPAKTPRRITALLRRLLQKDPRQRLRDIGDARLEIEEAFAPDTSAAETRLPAARWRSMAIAGVLAIGMLALGVAVGRWRNPPAAPALQWTAARLGGPRISMVPRLSPDGNMLAFSALIAGQTQLAVMNAGSGDWTLLTRDRERGALVHLAWARDGSRIYFSRHQSESGTVFAVPALGGEPRLVIENATGPEPLADGSILFLRLNTDGHEQLHRFWPETGRLVPLPVTVHSAFVTSLSATTDGREAVLFGRALNVPNTEPLQLLAVDVDSGRTRRLAPAMTFRIGSDGVLPVSVTDDGREVLIVESSAHSSTVIAVPRDGSDARRIVFTTTKLIFGVDEGRDGRLFVDQGDRSMEHLRFAVAGGVPEIVSNGLSEMAVGAMPLGGERTAYAVNANGRFRIFAARPREELSPFVEARDQAREPLVRLNEREFVFVGGTEAAPILTVAAIADGRIVRRLEGTRGRRIPRLAVSSDGQTIYFAEGGQIWTIPAADGQPRAFAAGESIATDPNGRFVLIQRRQQTGVQLVHRDGDGREVPLVLPPEMSVVRNSLWPGAVSREGRVALVVGTSDSWFWGPAIFDLNSGRAERVRLQYAGDVEVDLRWEGDKIAALARRIESSLWRFEPRKPDL